MNRSIRHHANRTFARLLAASVLTVAGAHLVQAQQTPSTPQNGPATRAGDKAELKTLEKNGYQPSATDPHYPQDIQNAEKKSNGSIPSKTPNPIGQSPQ